VITTADLLAAGLSHNAIARRVRSGVLRPVHRGVYLFGAIGGPLWAEVAVLKACGPRTVLSHQTALALWDLRQPPDVVHVTCASVRGDHEGVRQHRAELAAEDVTVRRGLPVTAAARTLLDVASATPQAELARLVEEAQVQRLATRAELVAAVQRGRGRPGVPRLRAALRKHDEPAMTRSEAERRLLGLIRAARLPAPRTNVRVGRHEVDFAWRSSASWSRSTASRSMAPAPPSSATAGATRSCSRSATGCCASRGGA
jgi:hypothetical protein